MVFLPPLCGMRTPPASLGLASWNETLATREHMVTFASASRDDSNPQVVQVNWLTFAVPRAADGHPPFRMLLRPTNYDEDNWKRLLLVKALGKIS